MNQLLDRIGNWNPQLLRELRGKLRMRNIIVGMAVPIVLQVLLLLYQLQRVPNPDCLVSLSCDEEWQNWWLEQFRFLMWLIPFSLFFFWYFQPSG